MIRLLTALPIEAAALSGKPLPTGRSRLLAPGLTLHVTGIGADAATAATEALLTSEAERADAWLSVGLAGALDPLLRSGDVVVASAVLDARAADDVDAARDTETSGTGLVHRRIACAEPAAHWLAERLREQPSLTVLRGAVLATARVLASAADKQRHATAAVAVDMESGAIASAASAAGIAFLCVRVIVDEADMAIPSSALSAVHTDGSVNAPGLALGLLRAPGEVPALIRLGRASQHARRSLRLCRDAFLALASTPQALRGGDRDAAQ
jgi:adenosylhomocysteine nucleosidase